MAREKRYTLGEEIANSVTHGVGAALSVAGLSVLVTLANIYGDAWRVVSFSIYGATMILLYLASAFYHAFQNPKIKRIFRKLDHGAIFLLIAGTYTPYTLVTLRGAWGWTIFGVIWTLAAAGVILTGFLVKKVEWLSVVLYISMGWIVLAAFKPLLDNLPFAGIMWLLAGGLFYTVGTVAYIWEKIPFNHAIWHVFVLAGSACHYFGILFYVLPMELPNG